MARSLSTTAAFSFCLLSCLSAVFQLSFCLNPRSRNSQNSSQTTDTRLVCPALMPIDHGFISQTQLLKEGELVALYSCVAGYKFETTYNTRICTGGRWIPTEAPSCEPITCPRPKIPDEIGAAFYHPDTDGYLLPNEKGYPIGTTMEITCRAGYHLSSGDHSQMECLSNGWSHPMPSCQMDSKEPTLYGRCKAARIDGGHIEEVGTDLVLERYPPGTHVYIKCQEGFEIVEPGFSNECQKNGRWQKKWTKCTAMECSQPLGVKNGGVVVRGEEDAYTRLYKTGATATYTCNGGYRLSGADVRFCRDGKWSSSPPHCVVPSCQEPKQIENGYFGIDGDKGLTMHSYHVGTTITYQCKEGYLLLGDSERTCVEHSKWSGNPPVCLKEVYCGAPEGVENGAFTAYGKYFNGMQVSYTCQDGYRLVGDTHRVCHDGAWMPALPICQSEYPVTTVAGPPLANAPQQLLNGSTTTTLVVVLTICGTVLSLLVVVVVLSLRACRYRCLHVGCQPRGQVPPPPYSSERWLEAEAHLTLPTYEEATGPLPPAAANAHLHLNFLPPTGRPRRQLQPQRYSRLEEEGGRDRDDPDLASQGSSSTSRSRNSSLNSCTMSTGISSGSTSRSHSVDSTMPSEQQQAVPEGNPLLSVSRTDEVIRSEFP